MPFANRLAAGLLAVVLAGCAGGAPVEPGLAGTGESDRVVSRPRAEPSDAAVAALESDLTNFKQSLIGLAPEEISDLFGAPNLERAEPPAALWQYRDPACTVDIFMFDGGRATRVDHVDVRMAPQSQLDERGCFREHLRKKVSMNR